jgi:hypothetical protein
MVIMVETISAAGNYIPPLIILKGKSIQQRWIKAYIPGNYLLGVTDSAYINDNLALE